MPYDVGRLVSAWRWARWAAAPATAAEGGGTELGLRITECVDSASPAREVAALGLSATTADRLWLATMKSLPEPPATSGDHACTQCHHNLCLQVILCLPLSVWGPLPIPPPSHWTAPSISRALPCILHPFFPAGTPECRSPRTPCTWRGPPRAQLNPKRCTARSLMHIATRPIFLHITCICARAPTCRRRSVGMS